MAIYKIKVNTAGQHVLSRIISKTIINLATEWFVTKISSVKIYTSGHEAMFVFVEFSIGFIVFAKLQFCQNALYNNMIIS